MTSKNENVLTMASYQTKARNPGNTVVAKNTVFDLLMTSKNENVMALWLYAYQSKVRNPGNTEAATNPVFGPSHDHLMT